MEAVKEAQRRADTADEPGDTDELAEETPERTIFGGGIPIENLINPPVDNYIHINQDIQNGRIEILVKAREVNDGTFDKAMDRVMQYVEYYTENIARPLAEPKLDRSQIGVECQ